MLVVLRLCWRRHWGCKTIVSALLITEWTAQTRTQSGTTQMVRFMDCTTCYNSLCPMISGSVQSVACHCLVPCMCGSSRHEAPCQIIARCCCTCHAIHGRSLAATILALLQPHGAECPPFLVPLVMKLKQSLPELFLCWAPSSYVPTSGALRRAAWKRGCMNHLRRLNR